MSEVVTDPQEQFEWITKNLQEVLNPQIIKHVLEEEKRPLKVYWGTAPTGKPHCGYFVPMTKLAHFLKAGCEVTVLLADLHAFLDNMKAPLEVVSYRAKYYEYVVKSILKSINVPIEKLKFVTGSEYQLKAEYTMDLFKLSNFVTTHDAKRAGAEVVKQVENPLLSGLIYPLMQALDEEYLGCDAQFGGVDQRKIFTLAEENLTSLGYKKRAHLMNPMVPGLGQGGKMSASDPNSKIDVLDEPKVVKKKIGAAFCAPGNVEQNGLLSFVEYVLGPIYELKNGKDKFRFHVQRPEKYGGDITYNSFGELKQAFKDEQLSPVDLKAGVSDAINELLAPIIKDFNESPEFQEAQQKGYPAPVQEKKKTKKVKDRGSKYPGAKGGEKSDDKVAETAQKLEQTALQ
ncbi:hypothetical protein KL905_000068 [Ogataea polymorpha]|uniref:Tyrosine--tRNA ligase n=1 Tax=Ogataea polymorpha TaxID=460523 RepID=A0A9P8P133_9ASCO|nr:hypothetical protein KL937_001010 [Ogataea polymorpha]KAG7891477.1 hypothetical protein KL936_001420 [Ogataea polymorpha]KAG7894831.1 hypothetical protein KL908_001181 [Ogataea polymorpha]KAG7902687.1 hypothetical protein KL935_001595 [Ogataea polymorpha]KAG7911325.1 hypothetical protein KL906_000646 [Ogataea polymorpha]